MKSNLERLQNLEPPAARNKYKEVCDMLREMAKEKPDMKLDIAACVLLSILEPLTEEDIKRGREIAKELKLAAPAVTKEK